MNSQDLTLKELVDQIQEKLDSEVAKNEELSRRYEGAQERADSLEKKVEETQDKLEKLEDLKKGAYQKVVTELFEGPSRKAARLSLFVALASIIIGLVQAVAFNLIAERKQSTAESKQFQVLTELVESLEKKFSQEIGESRRITEEQLDVIKAETKSIKDGQYLPGTELRTNAPAEFVVATGDTRLFRIAVPENTAKLRVLLTSITNDADLRLSSDQNPNNNHNTNTASQTKDCSSSATGPGVDTCSIEKPRTGYWYVRVRGYKGPAKVSLQATF